jgi:hypothetical protein
MQEWQEQTAYSAHAKHSFSRIYTPELRSFYQMGAELNQNRCESKLYLFVLCFQFPCLENDDEHSEVAVEAEGSTYMFYAERLAGGQKLLLPEDAKQLILTALSNGYPVQLTVGGYRTTLTTLPCCAL